MSERDAAGGVSGENGGKAMPAGGPERFEDLPARWQERLMRLVPALVEAGMAPVLSAEDAGDGTPPADIDCRGRIRACRAVCCSFVFALTEGEVRAGTVEWDRENPHLIARRKDGFCAHLDRDSLRCRVYRDRPLRCRRYDCRRESDLWEDGPGLTLRQGAPGGSRP